MPDPQRSPPSVNRVYLNDIERPTTNASLGVTSDFTSIKYPTVRPKEHLLHATVHSPSRRRNMLNKEVDPAWFENPMRLAKDLLRIVDPAKQQCADDPVSRFIGDVNFRTAQLPDVQINVIFSGCSL